MKKIAITDLTDLLNFARSVGKRLDEHRELAESIKANTSLFDTHYWHIGHMATQDDYLMRLFFMVHGIFPDHMSNNEHKDKMIILLRHISKEYVRPRPDYFGACRLPEYKLSNNKRISKEFCELQLNGGLLA